MRTMSIVLLSIVSFLSLSCDDSDSSGSDAEMTEEITIHRDEWGVPHIYGPTDASVVFGAAYAQAEDNWWQVEDNFVRAIGRGAELYGEEALLDDYLVRGLEIVRLSIAEYEQASDQMRSLYDAYAQGFNHLLTENPGFEKRLLQHIEPWHTLALIRFKYHHNEFLNYAGLGLDQSRRAMRAAQDGSGLLGELAPGHPSLAWPEDTVSPNGERALGSNEWAVDGSRTESGYPMLLINPHVSFFGLSTYTEVHLHSEEGLMFSGLTRFGFMLPYMGNNSHLGWAYTDNYGDHGDLYLEELDENGEAYRYDDDWFDLTSWVDTIGVKSGNRTEARSFRYSKTRHGPILGVTRAGRPLAVRLAKFEEGGWFEQWYSMMRAASLDEWRAAMALLNVSYMNTMYADNAGNILYIYNHVIPRRSPAYNWSLPVDGTDPGTEWDGYHSLDELPQVLNPASGYLQNTNSSPFTTTENLDLSARDFPSYMTGNEQDNRRARRSRQVLGELRNLTLDDFSAAVWDTRLIAADEYLDDLLSSYDDMKSRNPDRVVSLARPIAVLRDWNRVAAKNSVATTLFVLWAESVRQNPGFSTGNWVEGLRRVVQDLERRKGTWEVQWGDINLIQRPDASGILPFSDELTSLGVAGAPGWLGSVFTFTTRQSRSGNRYGIHGNSFVKVVEFTPEVQARSVFVFGQSNDPSSDHYFDQAELYSAKLFKPAWFQKDVVMENAEQTYTIAIPTGLK